MLEKTLESPLDCKEIQPVHSKRDHSWVFFGRTDVEAETPIFWPPHAKSWLIWKDWDVGEDWRQEEKGMTEDEMAWWHHRLDGHEFEWTLGVGDEQGDLVCCSSRGHKESDMTERLNWSDLFNKIRATKGIFHPKKVTIKNRNTKILTEAEDIKKRWQEYLEELYKKRS